jgi:hypothetical protein
LARICRSCQYTTRLALTTTAHSNYTHLAREAEAQNSFTYRNIPPFCNPETIF